MKVVKRAQVSPRPVPGQSSNDKDLKAVIPRRQDMAPDHGLLLAQGIPGAGGDTLGRGEGSNYWLRCARSQSPVGSSPHPGSVVTGSEKNGLKVATHLIYFGGWPKYIGFGSFWPE